MAREFVLSFKMENAAFRDEDGSASDAAARAEVARLLREIAGHVAAGIDARTIHDVNGNRVGSWSGEFEGSDD